MYQIATIYEDPITETKPEGKAYLIKRLFTSGDNDEMEYWEVEFLDEFGTHYNRHILKESISKGRE